MSTERLITVESSFPHEETVQRLEKAVKEQGMPATYLIIRAEKADLRDQL